MLDLRMKTRRSKQTDRSRTATRHHELLSETETTSDEAESVSSWKETEPSDTETESHIFKPSWRQGFKMSLQGRISIKLVNFESSF